MIFFSLYYQKIPKAFLFFITLFFIFLSGYGDSHYIALRGIGKPKYDHDFSHFSYASAQAPKGGQLNLFTARRFNQLNPYQDLGVSAPEAEHLFATLMKPARDNMEAVYPYLAEAVQVDFHHKWVIFYLRKNALFHNGTPITAQDIAFSFELLKNQGKITLKNSYQGVKEVLILDPYTVKFIFHEENRDLPYQLGFLPVFSKESLKGKDWTKEVFLVGSGPYKIQSYEMGKFIVYEHILNWWGENIPCNKGFYNFDTIKVTYYADPRVGFEAFKKGLVDWWKEERISNWYKGYDFPAFHQGDVKRRTYVKPFYHGLTGLFLNTRRPYLEDRRVRQALTLLFDFEWLNRTRFFNSYRRNKSIFMNSGYGATSRFLSSEEKKLLRAYQKSLVSQELLALSGDDTNKKWRYRLCKALQLLKEAGWNLKDRRLIHQKSGKPMILDLVVYAPGHIQLFQDFIGKLKIAGIETRIRGIDMAYYMSCLRNFDFDIILHFHPHVVIPGPEQKLFWSSEWSNVEGTLNLAGVRDSTVDDLVAKINKADNLKDLRTYTALLDRIISLGYYLIPGWTPQKNYVAYWKKLNVLSKDASLYDTDTWWLRSLEKRSTK